MPFNRCWFLINASNLLLTLVPMKEIHVNYAIYVKFEFTSFYPFSFSQYTMLTVFEQFTMSSVYIM